MMTSEGWRLTMSIEEGPATAPPSARSPGRLLPRLIARIIDALVLGVIGTLFGSALDFSFVWLTLQSVLVFAYFVVLDVTWGTTVGKRLLGLQVIGPAGGHPSVRQAAIREAFTLLGAVPYAGPVLALVAWIVIGATINSSPTGRGKHDELAGQTQVVAGR
jgi:uncharacterized RDD family membrane protein YckC